MLPPRICVVMSDNRPLQPTFANSQYNSHCAVINYSYCLQHGYDFTYYRTYLGQKDSYSLYNCIDPNQPSETRHAAWSKLLSILDAMDRPYDWIAYIDSDCIFKDFDTRIEYFFSDYLNKNIVFLNNMPWNPDKPCSGFILCRVDSTTRKYVQDWYSFHLPHNNKRHPYEQNALWQLFQKWDSYGLVYSIMFGESQHQFLRHLCHHDNEQRNHYFRQFIADKGIDYKSVLPDISCKEFDTTKCPSAYAAQSLPAKLSRHLASAARKTRKYFRTILSRLKSMLRNRP